MTSLVVDSLAQLVGFPTVSNRPVTEIAAWLAHRAEDAGFNVEQFQSSAGKANVVCTAGPLDRMDQGLVISGHMDVVPVEGQPWSSDPFSLTQRGGRLYGRGTADMKGFIASTVEALDEVDVASLAAPLVLVWTHDEEVGCLGSAHLADQLGATDRPLPREALIGEPTNFKMVRMHPGHVAVQIVATGESAHSSKPDLGASAIKAMGRALAAIDRLERELQLERRLEAYLDRPWVTLNTGLIHGGSAVNLVPARCEVTLGYRPLPGDDPLGVARRLELRFSDLDLPAGTELHLQVQRITPSLLTEEGSDLQALLAPHAHGEDATAAAFATDAGNLARLGIQSLIFGPGSIDVAHKADEYVELAELEKAKNIIGQIVRQRCG